MARVIVHISYQVNFRIHFAVVPLPLEVPSSTCWVAVEALKSLGPSFWLSSMQTPESTWWELSMVWMLDLMGCTYTRLATSSVRQKYKGWEKFDLKVTWTRPAARGDQGIELLPDPVQIRSIRVTLGCLNLPPMPGSRRHDVGSRNLRFILLRSFVHMYGVTRTECLQKV